MADRQVSEATCAALRRASKRGRAFSALAESYRLSYRTVAAHVRGDCSHEIDEPAAPFE